MPWEIVEFVGWCIIDHVWRDVGRPSSSSCNTSQLPSFLVIIIIIIVARKSVDITANGLKLN